MLFEKTIISQIAILISNIQTYLEFENPKELKKSGATKSSFSLQPSRREEKLLLSRISFYFSIRSIY